MRAMVFALVPLLAIAQDGKSKDWTGSVESYNLSSFPQGQTSGQLTFGIIQTQKEWEKVWDRIGEDAPKVDFEKNLVAYAYYKLAGEPVAFGETEAKEGVGKIEIFTGDEAKNPKKKKEPEQKTVKDRPWPYTSTCYYRYTMRAEARADLKKIEFTSGNKLLGKIELKKS